MSVDPRDFWENKIVGWERGRYEQTPEDRGLLERLADRASVSLRRRLELTGELVGRHAKGKRILDVGCGSGRLADALLAAGATSYVGIDLAEAAIVEGRARASGRGWGDRFRLVHGGLDAMADHPADIVVSLGLTDWLDDAELDRLFALGGDADVFHAISERRNTPAQLLHRAYVQVAYGWRTGAYIPRYFAVDDFAARIRRHRPGDVYVVRDPLLSFGALLTTLPEGEPVP